MARLGAVISHRCGCRPGDVPVTLSGRLAHAGIRRPLRGLRRSSGLSEAAEIHVDSFENELGEVARQGLARVDTVLLRKVAEQLWYSHKVPDLGRLAPNLRHDAGYLVDSLARFNVLNKEQKLRVLGALLPFKPTKTMASSCKDPLAVAWGASSDLASRLAELMPYQTRQYAADQAEMVLKD